MIIVADRIIDGRSPDEAGWVEIADGAIRARVAGLDPAVRADVTVDLLMPGLLDLHTHGAAGADFGRRGDDPGVAAAFHHRAGSTSVVASVATAPWDEMLARLDELRAEVERGVLAGIHLEGPWLAPSRRGAHAAALLRHPTPRGVDEVLDRAQGALRIVTIAAELPGAIDAIRRLSAAGVVVALGHSAADSGQVAVAVDAGARLVTHLFNGMPPLHHREPGLVGAALTRGELAVELIGDGQHVATDLVAPLVGLLAGRVALVSDTLSVTGLGDGETELAGSAVHIREGIARTPEGSLAGATVVLADVVDSLAARGVPWPQLVRAAVETPARVLGTTVPALRPGDRADLRVLFRDGSSRTMRGGRWIAS